MPWEVRLRDLKAQEATDAEKGTTEANQRALDWFTFFVADIQTGFGPFLSVYLTTQKWAQVDIGLILSIGSIAGLLGQVPGGWIVDLVRSKWRIAMFAVVGIGVSALLIAVTPVFSMIVVAKLLHAAASCILGPAIAAITLSMMGHAAMGPRLGRNARFASIGNGLAAGIMGTFGYFVSAQAVFYVTAILALPALLTLSQIRHDTARPKRADRCIEMNDKSHSASSVGRLLGTPAFLIISACVLLFHLANAAMLPLVGSDVTMRSSQWATAIVAACIVAPQFMVALISPRIGRLAQSWGRRPLLLIGFGALPIRGALLAWTNDPHMIVAVQLLDGVSAAVVGVLVPLALADISSGTGHFNLAQGIVGCAAGIGATLSTIAAGYLADYFDIATAFVSLAAAAACAFVLLFVMMPETMPTVD
jgi:MFS family permease